MTFYVVYAVISSLISINIVLCSAYVYQAANPLVEASAGVTPTALTFSSFGSRSYTTPPTRSFSAFSTKVPLPPLPTLPPLPKVRTKSNQSAAKIQTLYQVHSAPASLQSESSSQLENGQLGSQFRSYQGPVIGASISSLPTSRYIPTTGYLPPSAVDASGPIGPSGLTAPASSIHIQPQPLRIVALDENNDSGTSLSSGSSLGTVSELGSTGPFVTSSLNPVLGPAFTLSSNVGSFPTDDDRHFYIANGRQLKQYAVFEDISNDIEQMVENYLPSTFLDNFRARQGGTQGTPSIGFQIGSRANTQLQQQQQQQFSSRLLQQPDAIALGSGGLGYIRLSNGNVYLGSGSLGYISGQERNQNVLDARTRTGAPSPDALHFGHGALGSGFGK